MLSSSSTGNLEPVNTEQVSREVQPRENSCFRCRADHNSSGFAVLLELASLLFIVNERMRLLWGGQEAECKISRFFPLYFKRFLFKKCENTLQGSPEAAERHSTLCQVCRGKISMENDAVLPEIRPRTKQKSFGYSNNLLSVPVHRFIVYI